MSHAGPASAADQPALATDGPSSPISPHSPHRAPTTRQGEYSSAPAPTSESVTRLSRIDQPLAPDSSPTTAVKSLVAWQHLAKQMPGSGARSPIVEHESHRSRAGSRE